MPSGFILQKKDKPVKRKMNKNIKRKKMNPISIVDERLCLMYIALQIERIYLKCLSLLDTRLIKGRVQMFVASRYATHKKSSSNA